VTPDQQSLVELADQILRGRTSNDQLAEVETSASRVDDRLWAELAEAGLVGIAVQEEHGGAGLGLTEVCLLLEAQGRWVAPVPLWETAVAALAIARFGSDEQRSRLLPGVAAGSTRLSVAVDLAGGAPSLGVVDGTLTGTATLVPQAHVADVLLVVAGEGTYLVETAGLPRVDVVTTSHALASDVVLDGASAEQLGDATTGAWLADRLRVGLAAIVLGSADAGMREAASYLSGREQFGRALATFQAVSQQLGDAYCDVQAMRATLWQAVWALEQGDDARTAVDVATWWATDAGGRVQHVVQHLHGGMGADTTYPVHRRLLWTLRASAQLGGASRQLARLGPALV
jgi:alkylation response protein AidB-like acyl-CoA dehydrogenase